MMTNKLKINKVKVKKSKPNRLQEQDIENQANLINNRLNKKCVKMNN